MDDLLQYGSSCDESPSTTNGTTGSDCTEGAIALPTPHNVFPNKKRDAEQIVVHSSCESSNSDSESETKSKSSKSGSASNEDDDSHSEPESDSESKEHAVNDVKERISKQKLSLLTVDTPVGKRDVFFPTRGHVKLFVRELCTKGEKHNYRQGASGGRWVDFICQGANVEKYKHWRKAKSSGASWPSIKIVSHDGSQKEVPMCGFRVCFRKRENGWLLVTAEEDADFAQWSHSNRCTSLFSMTQKELQMRFPEMLLAAPDAKQAMDNLILK